MTTDTATLPAPDPQAAPLPRPRIRVGAIVWGLVLVAWGALALRLMTDEGTRAGAIDWLLGLSPLGWIAVGLLAVGALVTLLAITALIRRWQVRHGAAR